MRETYLTSHIDEAHYGVAKRPSGAKDLFDKVYDCEDVPSDQQIPFALYTFLPLSHLNLWDWLQDCSILLMSSLCLCPAIHMLCKLMTSLMTFYPLVRPSLKLSLLMVITPPQ